MQMKKRNIIILSASLLVLLLLALCVALPAILHRNSDVVSIDEEFNIVNDKILDFEADFISENGQLTIETSTTMLTELCTEFEELKETGKIKDYYYNSDVDTCIFAELPSGQGYIYAPSIEGFMGTPGNVEVVTIEPYRDDTAFYLRSDLLAYGKKPEIAAKALDDEFERVDYTLKYTPDNIIDSFDNIPKNSIILWMGHGGFNEKIGSVLFLNLPGDNEEAFINHYENLSNGAFATSKEDVLGITSKFIYSMEDDAFENCIVYLGSCNSMTDAYGIPNDDEEITNSNGEKKETISLYDSFLSKGAIAVAGNTQAVNIAYNFSMMHDFCYGLTQKHDNRYYTLNDAIEYAKEKNGKTDPWIFSYDSEMVVLCNDLSIGDKTLEEIYFPEEPDNAETNIEVTTDIVVDAVNYSREIISVFEWMDYSGYTHTIHIPKINLSSKNAQSLNEKIYNDHIAPYQALLNYTEEQMIYHVNYTYKVYENVVGIIVEFTGGPQAAGADTKRSYYYYDIRNDKEISLDEYIGALGYTTKELESILKTMEDISGYEAHSNLGDNPKLEACIADTESTLVVFTNAAYTMDGTTSYEVGPIIKRSEQKNPTQDPLPSTNATNSLIQANFSNWGYVVSDEANIYYYDGKNGIFKFNEMQQSKMIAEGNYSDMGLINKNIYCIEYLQSEDGSKNESVIVKINTENGSKEVVYKPISSESVIIGSNVIDNNYYFIVDNDSLLKIDENGEIENTQIRSAKKITPSGVYTSETSKYGLKLLAKDGKTLKTYSALSNYEVGVLFELDDYVYINYINYDVGSMYKLYRLNKTTGELIPFIRNEIISENFSYMSMNLYNDKFYIYANYHFGDDNGHHSRHKILSCDYNGDNIEEIYQKESDGSLPLCTLNIANQYLFINYPFTTLESEIIDLYNQVNISGSSEAASGVSSDSNVKSLKFDLLPNGTYSVVGAEGCEDTHIVIPEMYEGITVSAIGDNAFQNWSSLLSVEIPDSIVSIGAHAFEDCNALTDIQIPSNIEFVGEDAFSGSWKLPFAEDITNEYKAYYLGNDENPYLILIEFNHMSSSNRSYSYNVKYGTRVISGNMMMWGYKLTNITLPETLVAINDSVFANCISLREIIIPDSVKHIGSSAFHDLEAITEISIPDGISTIKSGLCALCYSLRSVKIPNSVTTIESGAFYFCPKLNSIEFSGTVDEWNSISKADGWDSECGNYTVYCTDGRI